MKRLVSLFIGLIFLLTAAMPVSAADDGYDELRRQIIAAMETGERLDISEYKLTREEMEEIYEDLFHRGLLPWYVDSFCDWTGASDGTIAVISLRDLRKRSFSEDTYERALAELIAETCHEGMTDLHKVLSVHDYIVSHVEYRYFDSVNNGYHALVRGETQCYGYSQLFLRVMDRIGIPCEIVICDDVGNGVGHAWNVVQIDGNWYHLDLTWDDSLPDAPGQALHIYFLKTDMEFKWKYGHDFGWETETNCKDKTYSDGAIWEDCKSPVIFLDADTMILRRDEDLTGGIYAVDVKTGEEKLLYSVQYDDIEMGGKYYYGYGTSLWYWDERIWFNTASAIYSITLDGRDLKTEYEYDVSANERYIFGFMIEDGILHISVIDIDYDVRKLEVELRDTDFHRHAYETSYVSATCETGGYQLHTCTCGITYQTDRTNSLGHNLMEEIIENGTCYTCQTCSYTYEEIVPVTESVSTQSSNSTASDGQSDAVLLVAILGSAGALMAAVVLLIRKKRKQEP